jgi:hypothetical protein
LSHESIAYGTVGYESIASNLSSISSSLDAELSILIQIRRFLCDFHQDLVQTHTDVSRGRCRNSFHYLARNKLILVSDFFPLDFAVISLYIRYIVAAA